MREREREGERETIGLYVVLVKISLELHVCLVAAQRDTLIERGSTLWVTQIRGVS
jgi:hypothetical protein